MLTGQTTGQYRDHRGDHGLFTCPLFMIYTAPGEWPLNKRIWPLLLKSPPVSNKWLRSIMLKTCIDFFYSCCVLPLQSIRSVTRLSKHTDSHHADFWSRLLHCIWILFLFNDIWTTSSHFARLIMKSTLCAVIKFIPNLLFALPMQIFSHPQQMESRCSKFYMKFKTIVMQMYFMLVLITNECSLLLHPFDFII